MKYIVNVGESRPKRHSRAKIHIRLTVKTMQGVKDLLIFYTTGSDVKQVSLLMHRWSGNDNFVWIFEDFTVAWSNYNKWNRCMFCNYMPPLAILLYACIAVEIQWLATYAGLVARWLLPPLSITYITPPLSGQNDTIFHGQNDTRVPFCPAHRAKWHMYVVLPHWAERHTYVILYTHNYYLGT